MHDGVLIVGAGPVGMVAARYLAGEGIPVTVIESATLQEICGRHVPSAHARNARTFWRHGILHLSRSHLSVVAVPRSH